MIGVVGASARAAVMTLARAGEKCWAVDLFNDRDLKRLAPCARCSFEDFPHAIPALAKQFPPGPVMYTGGLENDSDVIAELIRTREILGNGPDVVNLVRDPFQLANRPETLPAGATIPSLERSPPLRGGGDRLLERKSETLPGVSNRSAPSRHGVADYVGAGSWLIKSLRSSGGLGIRRAVLGEIVPAGHIGQEFIDGPAMSAVYRDGKLLGITEQLIGTSWLHAKPFHYAGTLVESAAQARGDAHPLLARRAQLKGFYGIDFILHDDTPYVLEINPRYPASFEAIEFAKHLGCTVGKAIYFAPHAIRFPDFGPWDDDLNAPFDPWRLPPFADIPEPGERFEPGWPVITFFAAAGTADECRGRLQSRAAELDGLFAGTLP